MNKHKGRKRGSTLVLIMLIICVIVVPLLLLLSRVGMFSVDRSRLQNIVEAAGLLAAKDASKIIINDANFGYVSLSNYPPIGNATCADDGEPLPVIGINTLVGTLRQNTIVAHELDNSSLRTLVDYDLVWLQATVRDLNAALTQSQSGNKKELPTDIAGEKVDTFKDVSTYLRSNLPPNVDIDSVQVSKGWLIKGGRTTVPTPKPERLAQLTPGQFQLGEYKPFIDITAVDRHFTFAGVGSSAALVPVADFRPADNKHICSIVRVDCQLTVNQPSVQSDRTPATMHFAVCCQPNSMPDTGPAGAMTLRFSSGSVPGLQSWSDFLRDGNFHDRQVTVYNATDGDYPLDRAARMKPVTLETPADTAQQFAEHFYYWLRNGHVRPSIDSIIEMVNAQFHCGAEQICLYEFTRGGKISTRIIDHDPFPVGVIADMQTETVADTRIQGGLAPIIIFRDDVKHLGTKYGGKHAGQPLDGYPINWCELPEFNGDDQIARELGKGRLHSGLAVINQPGPASRLIASNEVSRANNSSPLSIFALLNGQSLCSQPRKSFYSGGLALDIEIGGTRPSTAYLDVASMRKLKR